MKNNISIEVYQHDWIPGFAAYYAGSLSKKSKAHVVLNLGSLLVAVAEKEIDKKDIPYVVAETLMHEVIHVLEEWANVEFSEEKVEKMISEYQKKYNRN